jgi:uncharacterized protein (DUF2062 family)
VAAHPFRDRLVRRHGGTIIFGIARGIAGGVLSAFTTPYGLTWIAALLLAIAVAAWAHE